MDVPVSDVLLKENHDDGTLGQVPFLLSEFNFGQSELARISKNSQISGGILGHVLSVTDVDENCIVRE